MATVIENGRKVFTLVNGTTQLYTVGSSSPRTRLGRLVITGVGAAATVDIYDGSVAAGLVNPRWRWVTAEGKVNQEFNVPMYVGIRVVVALGGAEGYIVWGE